VFVVLVVCARWLWVGVPRRSRAFPAFGGRCHGVATLVLVVCLVSVCVVG
jgi:hypothetical protein